MSVLNQLCSRVVKPRPPMLHHFDWRQDRSTPFASSHTVLHGILLLGQQPAGLCQTGVTGRLQPILQKSTTSSLSMSANSWHQMGANGDRVLLVSQGEAGDRHISASGNTIRVRKVRERGE
ncbi:hypothetical protein JOB18_046254 [Solea senegalensis]|uniref:Uncharacterized protein n=2 Tax=Solea senegalensis TaxID=28829 RepID=A0AAV6R9G1_SOLSE|nr:hypothetical protein JOB18_046254 [Solea senegalensis]